MGALTTAIFNPALLSKQDLVRGFVARQDLLERLLDDLRRVQPETPPQHQLLIGQRGLGKTTMLRRLAFAIEDDPQLFAHWVPLVFPEEQYNIKNLGDFWLNCADALSDALDRTGNAEAAEFLDQEVTRVPADPNKRSSAALSVLVDAAARCKKGLVLLVDNLDIVLDRLSESEEWEFRRVISSERKLFFIGASSRALEALYEHGRAFYDYFQVHDLKGFCDEEMFAVLRRLAEEHSDEQVLRLINEKPARIRALRVLTGGNPRTIMLFYRVLSQGPDGDAQRDLEQLLDLYTPLYRARFEEMAQQAQQVVDAMAIHWDPLTAGDLAEKLAPLSVNSVSAQLKRLDDFGIIEKAPWFGEKKTAFQIAERFFNIWYLMRASRRVRRRLIWLVKFLEAWFEKEELSDRARKYMERNPEEVGAERYTEMALAYSQVVGDRRLRRGLETAALRASMSVSVRDLIDFSDLPPEVQDRRARMERLREVRSQVLQLQFKDIDSAELWRLLGGSPQLSLEEKAKVVKELPDLEPATVSQLFAALKHAEKWLIDVMIYARSDEVVRLYEALSSGDMTDALDVEGALAVAGSGYKNVPLAGLTSRTLRWADRLSPADLKRAEDGYRLLISDSEYEAKAWGGLGNLQYHFRQFQEAEEAYRKAIELDPLSWSAWNGLGILLQDVLIGRYQEAEQAYRKAIELDPMAAYAWHNLGNLLEVHLGRYEEAEQAYRKAIELDPLNAISWAGLGHVLAHDNDRHKEAEDAYRKSIELDADYAYAWGALAFLIEGDAGRQKERLEALERAAELEPEPPRLRRELLRRAKSLATGPLLASSVAAVSKQLELFPEDSEVKFTLAGLFALNGDWLRSAILFEDLALDERQTQPGTWAFGSAVRAGHAMELIAILEKTGADERWRPMYEALRALQAGSAKYLNRVAPEIRTIAEEILEEIKAMTKNH